MGKNSLLQSSLLKTVNIKGVTPYSLISDIKTMSYLIIVSLAEDSRRLYWVARNMKGKFKNNVLLVFIEKLLIT